MLQSNVSIMMDIDENNYDDYDEETLEELYADFYADEYENWRNEYYGIQEDSENEVVSDNVTDELEQYRIKTKREISKAKRKKVNQNEKIIAFIHAILATSNFGGGCKIIEVPKGKDGKYGFTKLAFFKQNDEENLNFWVNSIEFRSHHLYYITKNSYSGNVRTTENLFSLDNIVIDIDNHSASPQIVDRETERLLYFLNNDYDGKFPSYGIVRTGRGLQLWIGLQSVYASPKLQYRYEQLCRIFCEVIDGIVKEHGIQCVALQSENSVCCSERFRGSLSCISENRIPISCFHEKRNPETDFLALDGS